MWTSDQRTKSGKRRSGTAILLLFATIFWTAVPATDLSAGPVNNRIDMIPTITGINIQDGQLIASGAATSIVDGRVHTVPFSTTLDIRLAPNQVGAVCPILDLHLGPINLDLLGLVVKTSEICLKLTAYEDGGLLGRLLCAVGTRLKAGQPLEQILAGQTYGNLPGLSRQQVSDFRTGLKNVLNESLAHLEDAMGAAISAATPCSILHLELGPIHLDLLGLVVIVDDCDGGPVIVDVTGEKGLLGTLLCGLLGKGAGVGQTLAELLERASSQ